MKVKDLKHADYNPRKITGEQLRKLKKALIEFGDLSGIVFNRRTGNVVGGHQRLKCLPPTAMIEKTETARTRTGTVAMGTILIDGEHYSYREVDWPLDKEKAANIAANQHGGEFDDVLLADLIKDLQDLPSFDVDLLGFDDLELDKLMKSTVELPETPEEKKFHYRPGEGHVSKEIINKIKKDLILSDEEKQKFDKYKNILVQYSGGRDSTCALWWAAKNFPEKNITAVYSMVEVEFPAMSIFVEDVTTHLKINLEIVKSHRSWWRWIRDKGWPSIIFRPCQSIFIHGPVNNLYKTFDPSNTLLIDGSRAKQAMRGSKKSKDSKIPTLEEYDAYHPVYDLTEESIWQIIREEKIPIWKGYNMGFVRSACWCCPGQCSLQAAMLQKHYPGLCEEIRYWEKRLNMPLRRGGKGHEKTFDQIKARAEKMIENGATWAELYKEREEEIKTEGLS